MKATTQREQFEVTHQKEARAVGYEVEIPQLETLREATEIWGEEEVVEFLNAALKGSLEADCKELVRVLLRPGAVEKCYALFKGVPLEDQRAAIKWHEKCLCRVWAGEGPVAAASPEDFAARMQKMLDNALRGAKLEA